MNPVRLLLLLGIQLACAALVAQPSLKWGKPSSSELSLAECPFDPAADAVILAEDGKVEFINSFANVLMYRKIKILKATGSRHATIKIKYYTGGKDPDIIQGLKVQTLVPANGSSVKTELEPEKITDNRLSHLWSEVQFTFPNVAPGAILEYKYTLVTKRISYLEAWVFQHEIPTLYSNVKIVVPHYLSYAVVMFGEQLNKKYAEKKQDQDVWTLTDLPGYEKEKFVNNYNDHINKLQFQLKSYQTKVSTNATDQIIMKDVFLNWNQLIDEMLDRQDKFLQRDGMARKILDGIVTAGDSKEEKIRKIYRYVQEKAKWNMVYHLNPETTMNLMLKEGRGNSAEINLLLCLLLNEAGIVSYPVLVSTKDHGRVTREFPLLEQFNHLLVAIEEGEGFKAVDAVSASANAFIVPANHINGYGLLLKRNVVKWILLEYPFSGEKTNVSLVVQNAKVNVNLDRMYTGHIAFENRRQLPLLFSQRLLKDVFLRPVQVKDENKTDDYQDYQEHYTFEADRPSTGTLSIGLSIFGDGDNPFPAKTRAFDVEMKYPFSISREFKIALSPSDTLLAVPKALQVALPEKIGEFTYTPTYADRTLAIAVRYQLNTSVVPREYYEALRAMYDQMIQKLNEPIVVSKKGNQK